MSDIGMSLDPETRDKLADLGQQGSKRATQKEVTEALRSAAAAIGAIQEKLATWTWDPSVETDRSMFIYAMNRLAACIVRLGSDAHRDQYRLLNAQARGLRWTVQKGSPRTGGALVEPEQGLALFAPRLLAPTQDGPKTDTYYYEPVDSK